MRLRLVQQQQVGIGHQARRQRRQLALATRQLGGRPVELLLGDPERLQLCAHAPVEGVAVELFELRQQSILTAQHPGHAIHVGVHLRVAQLTRATVELGLDAGQLRTRGGDDLQRSAGVAADQLGKVGAGHVAASHRQVGVGFLQAGQDPQQGRFARPVGADHPDAGVVGHLQVEPVQHPAGAERLDAVFDRDQGHRAVSLDSAVERATVGRWDTRTRTTATPTLREIAGHCGSR